MTSRSETRVPQGQAAEWRAGIRH